MHDHCTRRGLLALLLAGSAPAAWSQASAWPSQPVRILMPTAPGAAMDVLTRQLNEILTRNLGQPFMVVNRAGGSGTIGSAAVATAAPDGYTLLATTTLHTATAALMPLPYDALRDFAAVAPLTTNPNVLVVNPASGYTTLKALVDAAKARPGQLSYGTAGVGTSTFMGLEMFRAAAGFEALHVPFKSTLEAVNEILGGRVTYGYTGVAPASTFVKDGRLLALAINSERRAPALPNVPTMAELGYPAATHQNWVGLLAPAKTPRDIVNKLNAEVRKAMAAPEMVAFMEKSGVEPFLLSPDEFDALLRREVAQASQLARRLNIRIQ